MAQCAPRASNGPDHLGLCALQIEQLIALAPPIPILKKARAPATFFLFPSAEASQPDADDPEAAAIEIEKQRERLFSRCAYPQKTQKTHSLAAQTTGRPQADHG